MQETRFQLLQNKCVVVDKDHPARDVHELYLRCPRHLVAVELYIEGNSPRGALFYTFLELFSLKYIYNLLLLLLS